MNMELWFGNLAAWWLQVTVIIALAALILRTVRFASARALLRALQALLGVCLFLPLLEPWEAAPVAAGRLADGRGSTSTLATAGASHPFALKAAAALLVAGILARLLWLAVGYARLQQHRRRAVSPDVPDAQLETLRHSLGVNARVFVCREIGGPVTFGFRNACVLLPEHWLDLDHARRRAIACHEFLHIRRGDWLWHTMEEIIRALVWFHPAIWWLIAEIRLAREQVVDALVVQVTAEPRLYVEALLEFAGVDLPTAAAPAFMPRRHLARRISSILQEVSMSKSKLIAALTAGTLCLAAAGVFAIWLFPLHAPAVARAILAPRSPSVHRMSENGMVAPQVLTKVDPAYTPQARQAKIAGTVVVQVEIGQDGRAHNPRIVRPLDPGLDRNALDAISQWRFAPGTKDGAPVTVAATIEINYRLL